MSNLSPRALALYQAHGPGPVDWERMVLVVDGLVAAEHERVIEAIEAYDGAVQATPATTVSTDKGMAQ